MIEVRLGGHVRPASGRQMFHQGRRLVRAEELLELLVQVVPGLFTDRHCLSKSTG